MRSVIIALLVVLLAAAIWWVPRHLKEQREIEAHAQDWAAVDRALGRLEAGIEHETKILLRTTIANTAAEIDQYVRKEASRESEPSIVSARRAIRHLEVSMEDLAGLSGVMQWRPENWGRLRLEELPKIDEGIFICEGPKPSVFGGLVESAHLAAAQGWLAHARDQKKSPPVGAVDLAGIIAECAEEDRAKTAAAQERKKKQAEKDARELTAHLKEWPVHIVIKLGFTSWMRVHADGKQLEDTALGQGEYEYDAREWICAKVPNTAQFEFNGRPVELPALLSEIQFTSDGKIAFECDRMKSARKPGG